MRRFISALAFVATLVVVLGAAGCGERFERGPGNAPSAADMASDALAALEDEGSAHFVTDLKSGPVEGNGPVALSLHFEGDFSQEALDAEGSVSFGMGTVRGRILVSEHDFFIQFMNQWYGDHYGLADAVREAKKEHDGQVWNELATPDGLRRNFDLLFDGEVGEGPSVDGVATWQFEGRLDAEGIITLGKRFGQVTSAPEAQLLEKVAEASKFVLVVGQEDKLPRRLELSVHVSPRDLRDMQDSSFGSVEGAENFAATLELSDFGKTVEIDPPKDFKPLDELFSQLFSGFE